MPRVWRRSWFRELAVGLAVLLTLGVAVWQSLSAPSPSGRPNAYVVINPLNGRVIASGPRILSGATVTLNPKTGQIVKVSGPRILSGATVTLNPKTGQIVKVSR
jgi:cell division protein FtsI/penicillin-binding protein 2